MRILHLSFHIGCAKDIAYIGEVLGHSIDFIPQLGSLNLLAGARTISRDEARSIWTSCAQIFNSYDIIITSDIVALARIFLENIDQVKPHIIVWICNRLSICMDQEEDFFKLLRSAPSSKVTLVPYTEFERIWAGHLGILVTEETIQPCGRAPSSAATINATFRSAVEDLHKGELLEDISDSDATNTFVVLNYGNSKDFIDLEGLLLKAGIRAVRRSFRDLATLKRFRGIIHLPDAFSKFMAAEILHLGVPMFVPSPKFLIELSRTGRYFFNVHGYGGQLAAEHVCLCDWYNYKGGRVYFDSFDDLVICCRSLKSEDLKADAAVDAEWHRLKTEMQWRRLLLRCAQKK